MLPTTSPTMYPSAFPSLSNCDIDQFIGRVYYVKLEILPKHCLKMEMYAGGLLFLDTNDATCTAATMSSTAPSISDFKKTEGNSAVFDGMWSGTIVFNPNEDPSPHLDIKLKEIAFSLSQSTFTIDLATSSCFAPSVTPSSHPSLSPSVLKSPTPSTVPSALPSIIPSDLPTETPSLFPSSFPSLSPSIFPSKLPSSFPSKSPSLSPSINQSNFPSTIPTLELRCPVAELSGKTYFVIYPSLNGSPVCLKFELFHGGKLYLDINNTKCTEEKSGSPQPISTFVAFYEDYVEFEPTGTQVWGGTFDFVLGGSAGIEFDTLVLNLDDNLFKGKMQIPSCTAPSSYPTTLQSPSPSGLPSLLPSDFPSKYPSMVPSLLPSDIPSVVPSEAPTPVCNVKDPSRVGDNICDDEPNSLYYTARCNWDGGDCDAIKRKYPNCIVDHYGWLGDSLCDASLNTIECGFDDGDCL